MGSSTHMVGEVSNLAGVSLLTVAGAVLRRTRPNAICIPNLAGSHCIGNNKVYHKRFTEDFSWEVPHTR